MEIKKGQKYKTKNHGDFHAGTNLIVIKVTGQNGDDYVFFEAETPKIDNRVKDNKRYNKFSCRVWWVKDYCELVENKRLLHFKFNENQLIEYLFKFAEYREGIGTLTEEDKELISSYVMHKQI